MFSRIDLRRYDPEVRRYVISVGRNCVGGLGDPYESVLTPGWLQTSDVTDCVARDPIWMVHYLINPLSLRQRLFGLSSGVAIGPSVTGRRPAR
jgi:hypothetical protein